MAKARFLNRTKYTKEYQKKVATMLTFSRERIIIPAMIIMINMFIGATALRKDPGSLNGWIMMLMGFIIFPLIFLLIPYLMTVNGYRSMTKDLKDNEFTIEAEFTSTVLRLKNSLGQTHNVLYEDISSIETNKNTLIIKEKNSSKPIYLDIDSFVEGTYQDLEVFLKDKVRQNNQN